MCALTVDWVNYKALAAWVKLQYSAVVTKASSCFKLISNTISPPSFFRDKRHELCYTEFI